jgi:hypothetical protein
MPVSDLIKKAKDAGAGRVELPAAVVKDMRLVLDANDKATNRFRRVSVSAFQEYVRKEYDLDVSEFVLRRYCTEHLKRHSWGKK